MQVTLVQAPCAVGGTSLAPPASLVSTAASVRLHGFDVAVLDLNLRAVEDPWWVKNRFFERALAAIAATTPDIVKLASTPLNLHLCIELARCVKAQDPAVIVILGVRPQHHAGNRLPHLFPWIDFVVAGNQPSEMVRLITGFGRSHRYDQVATLSRLRRKGQRRLRDTNAASDYLMPAYDLVCLDEYFAINPLRLLHFQHCTDARRIGTRDKAVDASLNHVERLRCLGARHLSFVANNFLSSKERALKLCAALERENLAMSFSCHAKIYGMRLPLLERLANAGFVRIHVDVGALSRGLYPRAVKQSEEMWSGVLTRLQAALDCGIMPECTIALGDCAEREKVDNASLKAAIEMRDLGCDVSLTPAHSGHHARRYDTTYVKLRDHSHAIIVENAYARRYPELFPCHSTSLNAERNAQVHHTVFVATTLLNSVSLRDAVRAREQRESLWSMCSRTAQRLGCLTGLEPNTRRIVVRDALASDLHVQRPSRVEYCKINSFRRLAPKLVRHCGRTASP